MNRFGIEFKPLRILIGLAAMLAMFASAYADPEIGTTRYATALRSAPDSAAARVAALPKDTQVKIKERRGAWLKVTVATRAGWLRLHEVRLGVATEGGDAGLRGFGLLWNLGTTGRSGSEGIVATTGIRGLNADDLENAEPDHEAVKTLERFQATEAKARRHAQRAGLTTRDVKPLARGN